VTTVEVLYRRGPVARQPPAHRVRDHALAAVTNAATPLVIAASRVGQQGEIRGIWPSRRPPHGERNQLQILSPDGRIGPPVDVPKAQWWPRDRHAEQTAGRCRAPLARSLVWWTVTTRALDGTPVACRLRRPQPVQGLTVGGNRQASRNAMIVGTLFSLR